MSLDSQGFWHGPQPPSGAGWTVIGRGPLGGMIWAPPTGSSSSPRGSSPQSGGSTSPAPVSAAPSPTPQVNPHLVQAASAYASAISKLRAGETLSPQEKAGLAQNIGSMSKNLLGNLYTGLGGTESIVAAQRQPWVKAVHDILIGQEYSNEPASGGPAEPGVPQQADGTGGKVEGETGAAVPTGVGQGGEGTYKLAGEGSGEVLRRIPVGLKQLQKRLGSYSKWLDKSAAAKAQAWPHVGKNLMKNIMEHINEVGVKSYLAELDESKPKVKSEAGPVMYDAGKYYREDIEGLEAYLNHHGIFAKHAPDRSVVSTMTPPQHKLAGEEYPEGAKVKFSPAEPNFKNKLEEARMLPGLETSEDLNTVAGHPVTYLTDDVIKKLDAKYGKGEWIVKPYDENAFAGHSVFRYEKAMRLRNESRNEAHEAKQAAKALGYKIGIDGKTGKIVGVKDKDGNLALFGTPEYEKLTKNNAPGMALERATLKHLKETAEHAHGIPLFDRDMKLQGKGFMAQPAFPPTPEDMSRLASDHPYAAKELRGHVVTRNGKAELIPHATFYKDSFYPIMAHNEETKAAQKAILDAINALPESERQGQIYGPDVIKTANGYNVVETNPSAEGGHSHWLGTHPLVIDSYVSHLRGEEPGFVKMLRRALTQKEKNKRGKALSIYSQERQPRMSGATLELPNYRQPDAHSCGFIAALTVVHYFNSYAPVEDVSLAIGPTKEQGCDRDRMVEALEKLNVKAEYANDLTIDKIEEYIGQDKPVIVTVYPENYSCDHWTVIRGIDKEKKVIYLSNYRAMSLSSFKKEWYDPGEGLVCTYSGSCNGSSAKNLRPSLPGQGSRADCSD